MYFEAFLACDEAPKIESGSVESRKPPEPDILCQFAGGGSAALSWLKSSRTNGHS